MIDQTQLLNFLGTALIGVLIWLSLGIFKRLDRIEAEQKSMREFIKEEIDKLKEFYHSINERVIRLEERDKAAIARPPRATDPPNRSSA